MTARAATAETPGTGPPETAAAGRAGQIRGTSPGRPRSGPADRDRNFIVRLTTWLGLTGAPGEATGCGHLDVAASLSSRWWLTITSPGGHAIGHTCAGKGTPHPGQHHPTTRSSRTTPLYQEAAVLVVDFSLIKVVKAGTGIEDLDASETVALPVEWMNPLVPGGVEA